VGIAAAGGLHRTGLQRGNRLAATAMAEVSKSAFLTTTHASMAVMAVIVAVSALRIGRWAPGRDVQQLILVRRASTAAGSRAESAY
jgi:hypothetical protein